MSAARWTPTCGEVIGIGGISRAYHNGLSPASLAWFQTDKGAFGIGYLSENTIKDNGTLTYSVHGGERTVENVHIGGSPIVARHGQLFYPLVMVSESPGGVDATLTGLYHGHALRVVDLMRGEAS